MAKGNEEQIHASQIALNRPWFGCLGVGWEFGFVDLGDLSLPIGFGCIGFGGLC